VIGRLLKRLLHRLIRGLIRARLIGAAVLVLALAGLGLAIYQGVQLPTVGFSLPGPKRAPQATDNFLKGNQTYNADLICSSLSDDATERLRARAGSCQEVEQRQLELARQQGARLEQIDYVGGHGLPDGTSLQFYVVASRGPTSRSEVEYVTYIFTLDRLGKIAKVQ
jgi:hypothetical protein